MKVFFLKKWFLPICCLVVFAVVCVAQFHNFSNRQSSFVSAEYTLDNGIYEVVELCASQKSGGGEAYIYLNGEEYAPISQERTQVTVYANAVIEVLCKGDCELEISYDASFDSLDVIPPRGSIKCQKGINYICRVVAK